jgi:hypothetical protein
LGIVAPNGRRVYIPVGFIYSHPSSPFQEVC